MLVGGRLEGAQQLLSVCFQQMGLCQRTWSQPLCLCVLTNSIEVLVRKVTPWKPNGFKIIGVQSLICDCPVAFRWSTSWFR